MKNKKVQQLIKQWDKRLKKSGFKDIESRKTGNIIYSGGDRSYATMDRFDSDVEKTIHVEDQKYTTRAWKDSQFEYYRLASQFLWEYNFKSLAQRVIWMLHAEGYTNLDIAKAINLTERQVWYSVKKLRKDMGLFPFKGFNK